ncbi:MAG TPA: hypothetical protein VHE78_01140 [Gemmatimonadaceae bacterium]|nr:hypothetical protein [Gemmatimonadaceae bacterium]
MTRYTNAIAAIALACAPGLSAAQHHQESPASMSKVPTSAGQAAYGTISEIVALLKADSSTDWSNVNIEALRQHLIDMDEVTMRSAAEQRTIPGGIEVDVTGAGRTMASIRRMMVSHASMLERGDQYRASTSEIPGGARLVVTARNPADASIVTRIRGLGFAGIMTEGDHHARHHIALARGEAVHGARATRSRSCFEHRLEQQHGALQAPAFRRADAVNEPCDHGDTPSSPLMEQGFAARSRGDEPDAAIVRVRVPADEPGGLERVHNAIHGRRPHLFSGGQLAERHGAGEDDD